MPVTPYILSAQSGRNHAWRYLATFTLVTLLVLAGSAASHFLVRLESAAGGLPLAPGGQIPPLLLLGLNFLPYAFIPLGLWIGLSQLHQRSFLSLINADWSFNWRRFFLSAGLWLGLLVLADLFLAWRVPGRYALTFDASAFFPFFAAALVLVPIQAAGEELLYRGYLAQGIGLRGGFWLAWLMPSLLFGLLHYNPAFGWEQAIPVIALSLMLGWITLRSGGLELAIGLHVVHNLYGLALVSSPHSPLPAPALLTVRPETGLVLVASPELAAAASGAASGSLAGTFIPLDILVYALVGLFYLVFIALLGRGFFPLGLVGHPLRVFQQATQPRLSALAGLVMLASLLGASGCLPPPRAANGQSGGLVLEECTLSTRQSQIRAECGSLLVDAAPGSHPFFRLPIPPVGECRSAPEEAQAAQPAGG
jgi:uncharacterized protein